MEPVLAALLGGVGGLVLSAVVYAFLRRAAHDKPITDVDELAVELDRVSKLVRRLTMQRLRQDALDAPPPIPTPQPSQPTPVADVKAELRRRVFGGNRP